MNATSLYRDKKIVCDDEKLTIGAVGSDVNAAVHPGSSKAGAIAHRTLLPFRKSS
jgi:hypothetical protein